MKTCLFFLLLFGPAASAMADMPASPRYAERVWLNPDGSARLEMEVDLPADTTGPIRLPASAAALNGLAVRGIEGARATNVTENDRRYVSIDWSAALTAPATLSITAEAPAFFAAMQSSAKAFGNRTMTYRFLNSTATVFAHVTNQVILPDGFVVSSVDDSEPEATDAMTTPPFTVDGRGGRHAISVTATNVGLGDAVSVTFRFKEHRVSPLIPIGVFVLAGAYLVGFRNLVSRS